LNTSYFSILTSHFSIKELVGFMQRYYYAFKAILLGLFIAQVLAVMDVYKSTDRLYETAEALRDAGYLAVPNRNVTESITVPEAALCGGMFFTLTVGACLSLLSFAAAWIWDRILRRNNYLLIPFLAVWFWCIGAVNMEGLCRIPTAYFLLIPVTVFSLTILWIPEPSQQTRIKILVHILGIAFLALISLNLNLDTKEAFIKIRDDFLLSNPVGKQINDFYYTYTLYAAEAFKSYDQKLIKTCSLALEDDEILAARIEKELIDHDYLVLDRGKPVDLDIITTEQMLVFKIKFWTILETASEKFLIFPRKILKEFSERSDKHVFFRKFTLFSILTVSFATIYFGVYVLSRILTGFFAEPARASIFAGMLTVAAVLLLLLPLHFETKKHFTEAELTSAMTSDNPRQRTAALKFIVKNEIDIAQFPAHIAVLNSPHIPERYWLAKTLGISRSPETYPELVKLLNDENFNVIYSAFSSLGQRGEKEAVGDIIRRIKISDNWYVQQYAYQTLKKLGWRQTDARKMP